MGRWRERGSRVREETGEGGMGGSRGEGRREV